MNSTRVDRIRQRLVEGLAPSQLEIVDDSHHHAGHAGARDGRGHFTVIIVSAHFEGVRTVQRHRLVYDAVGDLMQTDIHALSIHAMTPAEADAANLKASTLS
jgi:BolA protein